MIIVWYALGFLLSSVGFALVVLIPLVIWAVLQARKRGRLAVVDASRSYGCGLGCCRGADGDLGIHFLSVMPAVSLAKFQWLR